MLWKPEEEGMSAAFVGCYSGELYLLLRTGSDCMGWEVKWKWGKLFFDYTFKKFAMNGSKRATLVLVCPSLSLDGANLRMFECH